MAIVLALASLACAFIGTYSRPAYTFQNHLPTLTRTPLPTLTPTGIATQIAVAEVTENHSPPSVPQAASESPIIPTQSDAANVPASPLDPPAQNAAAAPAEPVPANSGDIPINPPQAIATATLPPDSTPTAPATPAPTDTATPLPTETPTITPTPTATPLPAGWAFTSVRLHPDSAEGGLLLYGNLINNTDSAQELEAINGTFYDGQGQVVANQDSIYAYWPGYVVPPHGDVPFELAVDNINNAADFDLSAQAAPSGETPRQDFEFLEANQWMNEAAYCVGGKLRNPGGGLQNYLIIAVTLYDEQDKVINFGDYEEFGAAQVQGDQTAAFEICVEPPNQPAARHELRAWGQ